jgi:hypothetical protein
VITSGEGGPSAGRQFLSVISGNTLSTTEFASASSLDVLGWSDTTQSVMILGAVDEEPVLFSFDPESGEFRTVSSLEQWFERSVLFDDGTWLAGYTRGWWPSAGGSPTSIVVYDVASGTVQTHVELEDVIEGVVPDGKPGNTQVYASPVFDSARAKAYVVHGDGLGVTSVDLASGEVHTERVGGTPFELPEEEYPGITLTGFGLLSDDGRRLLIGGTTHTGTRLPERNHAIQMTQVPHSGRVFDTEALRFIAEMETPVSDGVAVGGSWAVTSSTADGIYCDQGCDPSNSDPEVLSQSRDLPGLTLIDQTSLEVRNTLWPGADFFHFSGVSGQQVIVESLGDNGDYHLSINATVGEITGQLPLGDTFFAATQVAVFEMRHGS